MKKTKKILVVSGFQPYPDFFGGAVDVWERIKGMVQLGHSVDLLFTDKIEPKKEDILQMQTVVNQIFFTQRKNSVFQLVNSNPLQVESRKKLKNVPINKQYDIVVCEGQFVGYILDNPTLKYKKIVVRVHNDEVLYFKQLKESSQSFLKKMYYSIEVPKIQQYSDKIFKKADQLWFISNDEYQKSEYKNKGVFMPAPINQSFAEYSNPQGNTVLFLGSLFMPNNLFAIDWYIENVHYPLIRKNIQDYKLVIVGATKSDAEQHKINKKYCEIPNVEVHFNQENLMPFYQQTKAFINPMFHGSGVKIKSINAIINALPLVSTDIGAEGMGLLDNMFWRANSSQQFLEALLKIFQEDASFIKKKVLNAQNHLKNNHYLSVLEQELNKL